MPPAPNPRVRRRNKSSTSKVIGGVRARVPCPDGQWHPLAREWFRELSKSGQAVLFEPSDWAQARILAVMLDRWLTMERAPTELIKAFQTGAAELLTTEGSRRRHRVDLDRGSRTDLDADAEAVIRGVFGAVS